MLNKILRVLKREKLEYVLIGIMTFIITMDFRVPNKLANGIDTVFGRVLLVTLAFILLLNHRVLGVVSIVFVFMLINKSSLSSDIGNLKKFVPSETKKDKYLNVINQFPVTLEEEQVKNLVPIVNSNVAPVGDYKPVSNDLHSAAKI